MQRAVSLMVTTTFVAASLTLPMLPYQAMAQPRPDDDRTRIFVFPLSQAPDVSTIATNRLDQFLRGALSINDGLHVLQDADLIVQIQKEPTARTATNAHIEAADGKLWEGKELLEKKKDKQAAEVLQQAVDLYRDNYADLVDYDKLVDSYVQLAEAFFRAGYGDNGREALSQALSLKPTLTVDRRLQHKDFVGALDKLEADFAGHKPGTLQISSSPPGGKVYIDGVLRGNTPITLTDLRKGTHFVQIRLEGYQTNAQTLRAPMGDQRQNVAALLDVDTSQALANAEGEYVSPEPLMPYVESGNFNDNFRRAAKTFTERAFVNNLLYGYVARAPEGYALHLFLYDANAAEIASLQPITFDSELANAQVRMLDAVQVVMAAVAAFPTHRIVLDPPPAVYRTVAPQPAAAAILAPPVVVDPNPGVVSVLGDYPTVDEMPVGVTEIGDTGSSDDTEWYETWWFWTIVGVGAAGTGVGIAAAAGAFDTDSSPSATGFGGSIQLP